MIRYTTDGSEPTATNGSDYAGPLTLNPINSRKAHVIRARAFSAGLVPSRVKSASYLIAQSSNIRQAPALMITADEGRSIVKPPGVLSIEGGQYVNQLWEATDCDDYNCSRSDDADAKAYCESISESTLETLMLN